MPIRLGVNIDHVATLRQARGTHYPDPIAAALQAIKYGADGITMHLREDRRHIQDVDVINMKKAINVPLNLEMAATEEMLEFALHVKPTFCCIVPEKREELTTEGGLDVIAKQERLQSLCQVLQKNGTKVSLFIEPNIAHIQASKVVGASIIELHTGGYAEQDDAPDLRKNTLTQLKEAAIAAHKLGLIVNAGHGLNIENIHPILRIPHLNELNIGHSLIADALEIGLGSATKRMKSIIKREK